MSLLSVLSRDIVDFILGFIVDDDNEYGVLRQVSKLLDVKPRKFVLSLPVFVMNIHRLQWAKVNECPWNSWTCAEVAKGGYLEVLQWLRANDCPWDETTCYQ